MSEENKKEVKSGLGKHYKKLTADFPAEALKAVPGRLGLTSIKPQYIIERLNETVGLGNWVHAPAIAGSSGYQDVEDGVFFFGTLHVRDGEGFTQQHAVGFCARFMDKKKTMPKDLGDMYKAAKTDSLSKSASLYGIGNSVFKGLVAPPKAGGGSKPSSSSGSNGDF